jgi:hypothetical protein
VYLHRLLKRIHPACVRPLENAQWRRRGYAAPSPSHVKHAVLLRAGMPEETWIETGTFLGDTTALLARRARMVYSIEPEPKLHERAHRRFEGRRNVEILRGTSEEVLPGLLARLCGDVNFWLDGHYSAGVTFRGPQDTPIVAELTAIAAAMPRLNRIAVMIDDLRCFNPRSPEHAAYPTRSALVDWANRHGLTWHIEHDIFVARHH